MLSNRNCSNRMMDESKSSEKYYGEINQYLEPRFNYSDYLWQLIIPVRLCCTAYYTSTVLSFTNDVSFRLDEAVSLQLSVSLFTFRVKIKSHFFLNSEVTSVSECTLIHVWKYEFIICNTSIKITLACD